MSGIAYTWMGYQETLFKQWLRTIRMVGDFYAGILDPRPDLSVPARRTTHHPWWW